MGSLTVGGAAAVGTGAFTSVEADRSVNVAVADDASAYLGLDDIDSSPNSQYIDTSGDQIVLNLDSTDNSGSGFNADAETRIDDLIRVSNQGTQTINVWVTLDDGNDSDEDTFDDDTLYFYPGDATDTALNNGQGDSDGDNVLGLTPGESADLGAFVDLGDVSSGSENPTATFHADVDEGGSEPVDDSGGSFAVVAEDGSGDFTDLQTAIDQASGSTIAVKDTGTPLDIPSKLTIPASKTGLELRGINGKPTLNYIGGYPDGGDGIVSKASDVTIQNVRFKFNGNAVGSAEDDSLENFSGGNQLFAIEGDGTTLNSADIIADNSGFEAPLAFLNTDSASGVTIENSLFDVVDSSGTTVNGAGSGQNFIGARFVRNNTFRGNARIATQAQETATIRNNNLEGLGFTEGIAIDSAATNVLVKGNTISYDPQNVTESFSGAEIRVEPDVSNLKVNGTDFTGAQALANELSTSNTGSQPAVDPNAKVVVRSTSPNTFAPPSE